MAGDPGFDRGQSTDPLTPVEFRDYAVGVGVLLAAAHWLLGQGWAHHGARGASPKRP